MTTSSKLEFLVKREDTGEVIRIEMEEDKQIFDLLKLSSVLLEFKEDAKLCVYPHGGEEITNEAFHLREVVDPNVILIIKDKRMEEVKKFNEKEDAKDRENMIKATKMKEIIDDNLNKRDKVNNRHDEFLKQFSQQGPRSSQTEGKLLDYLNQQMRKDDTANEPPVDARKDEEIRILTTKINSEGLEGYVYEIIPESYTDQNESSYYERSFSSDEERRSTQSKVNSSTNWSSWQAEGGFSGWGVSVSASAGQKTSTSEQEGRKTQNTQKSCVAVVTKTSFHQMKKFMVNVKLGEKAIKDAKNLLYPRFLKKKEAIIEFNNKYCSYVYSGQFSAGGWFRTVATARSNEAMEFTALEREATEKAETYRSAGFSGFGLTAGGGQNRGSSSQTNSQQSQQNTKSSIQVLIRKESAPGNTSSENDLEMKIKEIKNCTIFPVVDAKKSHFIPVYEIIENQAEAIGDKELAFVPYLLRLHMKGSSTLMGNLLTDRGPPYVVLLGDVGTGKSTLVEKLTGKSGRSSDSFMSYTRSSEVFWVPNGSLIVADTPGSNALEDKLEHNIWIAAALNYMPVSRIFIVVKAEPRIDPVISNVRKYADSFVELPMDVVAVLVTHMDIPGITWPEEKFTSLIDDELGIDTVVFSSKDTAGETLVYDILKTCTEEHDLTIDSGNLFKLFKIHNNNRKILKSTSDEVKNFTAKKRAFDEARKAFSGKELIDLVFEFQAYMTEEIMEAQKRMCDINNFTFDGDGAANEAGHVANMVNQLRAVLYDIRTECAGFQIAHGVSELRKCPHCGLIWTRVEGCDGETTCGRMPSFVNDIRDPTFSVLATFSFRWVHSKLTITKSGDKSVKSEKSSKPSIGCGKSITWKNMPPVAIPPEFEETVKGCTSDIDVLPLAAECFRERLDNMIGAAKKVLIDLSKEVKDHLV